MTRRRNPYRGRTGQEGNFLPFRKVIFAGPPGYAQKSIELIHPNNQGKHRTNYDVLVPKSPLAVQGTRSLFEGFPSIRASLHRRSPPIENPSENVTARHSEVVGVRGVARNIHRTHGAASAPRTRASARNTSVLGGFV